MILVVVVVVEQISGWVRKRVIQHSRRRCVPGPTPEYTRERVPEARLSPGHGPSKLPGDGELQQCVADLKSVFHRVTAALRSSGGPKTVENIFKSSRFLVIVAVVTSAVSAALLYGASLIIIFNVIVDFIQAVPTTADAGKALAVKLLKILDLLLIAITFQIISVSLYRLFIRPRTCEDSTFLGALEISSFHDLKITLVQVAVVILVILFLEHAVEVGATLESLYFGLAVGVVILASVHAWKHMKH